MNSDAAYSNLLNEKFTYIMKEENAEVRRGHIESIESINLLQINYFLEQYCMNNHYMKWQPKP